MKRLVVPLLACCLIAMGGCKPQHPSVITIEPGFEIGKVNSILLVPTVSGITKGDDPARESERVVNNVLWERISDRGDYTFLSPEQFRIALSRADLGGRIDDFNNKWIKDHVVEDEFLAVARALNVDMLMIPYVYLWSKDEADYREDATSSATQVGVTLTMLDPVSGKVMWEATDENYVEAMRTEGDRVQASDGGLDRRVAGRTLSGKDAYSAPPFEDVAILVIEALVQAVPEKTPTGN